MALVQWFGGFISSFSRHLSARNFPLATMSLPSHIVTKPVPKAGNGLFTEETIGAGEEIFCIERPLVSVLDSPRLQDICATCFRKETAGIDELDSVKTDLNRCLGCKVVKYCSKVGLWDFLRYLVPA